MDTANMETLDLAIVGAGWHGMAMAKTYIEVCPEARMAVFDSAMSVGGTWAKERLYPGLKTNNLIGSYEFGDFPMTPERFGAKRCDHIPGAVVHDYLTQFAEHFKITPHIRFQKKVESARLLDNGHWVIRVVSTAPGQSDANGEEIVAKKLVLATGLTSEPLIPPFEGLDDFNRDLFHAKELKNRADELAKAKEVVVLGGNKSSWDVCFFAAKSGAHVNMVMRPEGGGPSFVWPVLFSPLKWSVQRMAATRIYTWFDPCIWTAPGPVGWIRHLLHQTFVGRKIVTGFWNQVGSYAQDVHQYDNHRETQKLKPWVNPYWMGNSLSVHNYATPWLDLVREGKISVHIADVAKLSEGTVHLSNGTDLKVDAFVCCTGWKTKPPVQFIPEDLTAPLGVGTRSDDDPVLREKARAEVYAKLPSIKEGPNRSLPPGIVDPTAKEKAVEKATATRYQLYRFLVPPNAKFMHHRNIAFIGSHLALTATMVAQVQALWITAFFQDEISNLNPQNLNFDKVQYETVLHNEYSRVRHPHEAGGCGDRCPDLAFDCFPYVDLLMDDLELPKYRKSSFIGEVYQRYRPDDYKGLVQEWLNHKQTKAKKA